MGKSLALLFTILFVLSCSEPQTFTKIEPYAHASVTIQLPPVVSFGQKKPTRSELLAPMLEQIRQQTEEMLPFDEPRHEGGEQLDGKLRDEWIRAYYRHKQTYEFNGDKYYTMHKGKPFVPQVCVDFVIDTLDRTSGTWYAASLRYPHRTKGRMDFRSMLIDSGYNVRSVNDVIKYFRDNPHHFDVLFEGQSAYTTSQTKQLQLMFKSFNVGVGDIVFIKGRAPWDHGREVHWHSFFITGLNEEGFVEKVTGNPIYPVERTLKVEGNRTPKRRVVAIVRLTDELLMSMNGVKRFTDE